MELDFFSWFRSAMIRSDDLDPSALHGQQLFQIAETKSCKMVFVLHNNL